MRLGRVLVLILLASVLQAASPRDQLRQGAYARFGYTDVKTRTAIYVLLLRAGSELPADLPDRPRREDPYFSRIEDAGGFKKYGCIQHCQCLKRRVGGLLPNNT